VGHTGLVAVRKATAGAQMNRCGICKRELNVASDPTTEDCGGDCLRCMADAGDPDAINAMSRFVELRARDVLL
jgi:hypothetical protein